MSPDCWVADRIRMAARPQVFKMLNVLRDNPGMRAAELREVADTSVAAVQILLVQMSRLGLVTRAPVGTDGGHGRGRRGYSYSLPEPVKTWLEQTNEVFGGEGGGGS